MKKPVVKRALGGPVYRPGVSRGASRKSRGLNRDGMAAGYWGIGDSGDDSKLWVHFHRLIVDLDWPPHFNKILPAALSRRIPARSNFAALDPASADSNGGNRRGPS